ncbi:M42 family metallopeptidase [Candidatus Zixiibacteriota bacterium]
MKKASFDFLKGLLEQPSPSGFEQPVQKVWRRQMKRYADEVYTDVHGNAIAVLNPSGKPRVMLAGHCDEVGFMVNFINDEGFIYFAAIGGVDAGLVSARRVKIFTEKGVINGVVGRKAIHMMDQEERKKVPEMHKLWIDIGVKDKKEAEKLVSIGDPIIFNVGFEMLRNDLAVSRGFDDRIGSFAVAETLRLLAGKKPKASVYAVSTVQEELGMRGARTSAFGIDPDVGIAVDVGNASDFPGADKQKAGEMKLGMGPVIVKGANINPVVGKGLLAAARKSKIPFQTLGAPRATGTDANAMQLNRAGVAAGLVSVPNRYMHTPVEMISLNDLDNTSKLIATYIMGLTPKTDFTP